MPKQILKAYKVRLYPNEEQKIFFAKSFGCTRFIWNKMLSDKIEYYQTTKTELKNTPAQYKKEFEWLKEVDSLALANVQQLRGAYNKFFKQGLGFPKFKKKVNVTAIPPTIKKAQWQSLITALNCLKLVISTPSSQVQSMD